MRLSNIILVYFMIGAILWGGGVISWQENDAGAVFLKTPDSNTVQGNSSVTGDVHGLGDPISQALSTVAGGSLIAVWSFIKKLIGLTFWPVTVMIAMGAPVRLQVLIGGSMSLMFVMAFLKVFRPGT
jgi:hypothetical protein